MSSGAPLIRPKKGRPEAAPGRILSIRLKVAVLRLRSMGQRRLNRGGGGGGRIPTCERVGSMASELEWRRDQGAKEAYHDR